MKSHQFDFTAIEIETNPTDSVADARNPFDSPKHEATADSVQAGGWAVLSAGIHFT